ncbi:MAG: OmpH family outer membrane protein [Candidatus Omnitrophica bacterium]|nr:OmpH family outer membrane protein [Candidatus Omnitrophota bacterium]
MKIVKAVAVAVFFSFLISMFICPSLAFAKEIKMGYVNLGKTFDEYSKTKQADAVLEKKSGEKEKERQKMVDEISKLKDELELLNDKAKQDKQVVIDEKLKKLQEFVNTTREELNKQRDEIVKDIVREIDKIIQDYGKQNGYTVILNDRVLVYGEDTLDVTQDIIDILNKNTVSTGTLKKKQ